jgi:hypothetical protein
MIDIAVSVDCIGRVDGEMAKKPRGASTSDRGPGTIGVDNHDIDEWAAGSGVIVTIVIMSIIVMAAPG